jgi:hypothetical protein
MYNQICISDVPAIWLNASPQLARHGGGTPAPWLPGGFSSAGAGLAKGVLQPADRVLQLAFRLALAVGDGVGLGRACTPRS